MKALTAGIIFVLLPAVLTSAVFDLKKSPAVLFAPDFTAARQGTLSARINGAPVNIESYETGRSADEIMQYYSGNAKKNGYALINGRQIKRLAAFLINMGMDDGPDKWYYLFYKKNNGELDMVTTGEFGRKTRIVTASVGALNGMGKARGFDDHIRQYPGFEKVLGIEILSGTDVISFANFYRSENPDRYSVKSYYEDYLPKNKWAIQRQYKTEDTDMFLLEKNGKTRMLDIYETDNSEKWVMVMGK